MRDEGRRKNNRIPRARFHTSYFRLHTSEGGQALIELVIVLPLFFLIIAALIFFGRALYVQIALDMAAYDGCRAAVEPLHPGDGENQGMVAARGTLAGFNLNAEAASIAIEGGGWGRGALVRCTASYNLFVGDVPWLVFHSGTNVSLRSVTYSRVETWRSDWQ
jgi:Flp pilus assembly protein TadG